MLRRLIATFTLFVFVTLLASSAVAGVLSCASDEPEGCCCAKDEGTEHANYSAPGCECPACACTVEDQGTPQPFAPMVQDAELPSIVAVGDVLATAEIERLEASGDERTEEPRGPPERAGPPFYILYDTLLI